MPNHVPVLDIDPTEARKRLSDAGADIEPGNTEYERWRATLGNAIAIGYDDTVVVQGERPSDILTTLADRAGHGYLYVDGAARGNPGPAAIGWVVLDADGIVDEGGERIGTATNNEAEYVALKRGLEIAARIGFDEVSIYGDSELIVNQVTGAYSVDAPHLKEHRVTVLELLEQFDDWSITAVPREVNRRADALANEALDDH